MKGMTTGSFPPESKFGTLEYWKGRCGNLKSEIENKIKHLLDQRDEARCVLDDFIMQNQRLNASIMERGKEIESYITTIGRLNREIGSRDAEIDRLRDVLETVQASYTIETPEIVKTLIDGALKEKANET